MLSLSRFLDPVVVLLVVLGLALFLALRGAVVMSRVARRARVAAWVAWGALWCLSTPLVSDALVAWTETRGPDLNVALAEVPRERVALVVLAAGLRTLELEPPPRERLDAASTQRVLTASRLWREQRFGMVLFSGSPPAEADGMTDLAIALGVPADRIVREDRSLNTRENAANSSVILKERGAQAVVLVTSATHLRRAVKDFAAVGVQVIPAAADLGGPFRIESDSFLPSAHALTSSQVCLHELLGYLRG
jgi:uncharacterized SAM-binding protein YcdF (DUF218 family)